MMMQYGSLCRRYIYNQAFNHRKYRALSILGLDYEYLYRMYVWDVDILKFCLCLIEKT